MSKKCAKCEKTVYPLEELKCLDKMWHKGCFKCQECGMTLNMRNYKGFNRLPYCTAHCPQAKHTTVADTPEIRRIQENTKIQSTVKYHEEFEKQKGKVTQIADDPETLRIRQNTKIISNVAYHGDLERKAQMEQKRPPTDEREDDDKDHIISDEDFKPAPPANNVVNSVPVVATNQVPIAQAYQDHPPPLNPAASRVIELEATHAKDSGSPYSSRQASTVIYTSEHGPGSVLGF